MRGRTKDAASCWFYRLVRRLYFSTVFPLEIVELQIAQVNRRRILEQVVLCSSLLCGRLCVSLFFFLFKIDDLEISKSFQSASK